ncbi:hypothetical protein LCGC14_1771820 [marine sediment metagenome]|uniref:Uncharacterized protein n=1 Tax=marine sediment metagenome TaxID=412755 RepID=A0A0F9GY19_9ZZZZ
MAEFYSWKDMREWKEMEIFDKNFFPSRTELINWWNSYVGCRTVDEIEYNLTRVNRLYKYFTKGI